MNSPAVPALLLLYSMISRGNTDLLHHTYEVNMTVLSRFDHKRVEITAEDGSVCTGTAEVYPSGYGLHEFDRAEESIN